MIKPLSLVRRRIVSAIGIASLMLAATQLVGGNEAKKVSAASIYTIMPAADTYVRQSTPTSGYGTSSQINAVGGSDQRIAYLRFNVSNVIFPIASAKLRLVVTNDSTSGGVFSIVPSNTWAENINWNTRPPLAPAPFKVVGSVAVGAVIEVDVTDKIQSNSEYSFAIAGPTDNTNTVGYASREASTVANRPSLIIQSFSSNVVVSTPTSTPTSAPVATNTPTSTSVATSTPTSVPVATNTPTSTSVATSTPTSAPVATSTPTTAPKPTATPGTVPTATPQTSSMSAYGYLGERDELLIRKALAAQGLQPYQAAVSDAINDASGNLGLSPSPQSVIDIPDTTGPFYEDTATAYSFALSYVLTNDVRYATKAREFIMAWVNTAKSTANTCTNSGACQTSLIISRCAPGFVFAADLIKPSGVFSAADDAAFKSWLATVILPTASERTNNWGDAGTFMRVAVADYIGDQAKLDAAVIKLKSLIDLTAADGSIPEETRRGGSGINYSQESLDYRLAAVKILERRGIDLWSYGRLRLSAEYLAPYVLNPSSWPWASGASASTHPLWEIAYQKWGNPIFKTVAATRRPYGNEGNSAVRFTTLTNGNP